MTIIRVAKRREFVRVDKRAAEDGALSYRARGVLLWLLAKPDDWEVRVQAIQRAAPGKEGRDAIRTALRELEKCGYIEREVARRRDGTFESVLTVFEHPTSRDGFPGLAESSGAGEPSPDFQATYQPPSTNEPDHPPCPPTGGRSEPHADIEAALLAAFGFDEAEMTRPARRSLRTSAAALVDVAADPAEIPARLEVLCGLFTATPTVPALVRHWAQCAPARKSCHLDLGHETEPAPTRRPSAWCQDCVVLGAEPVRYRQDDCPVHGSPGGAPLTPAEASE